MVKVFLQFINPPTDSLRADSRKIDEKQKENYRTFIKFFYYICAVFVIYTGIDNIF